MNIGAEPPVEPASGYQPLRLLRNKSYPTYQLYAVAGQGKTPPETVLTIAVLETMQWLRQRFREFELPAELDWPDSSCYADVDCSQFASFQIDAGYKVEVIWLQEEKIWTLQLTEPDLGPQPGTENQNRSPVPGRIFETNVAYRIVSDRVECGFRTVVSEPEGTSAFCEVYRLAIIKHLVRNPLVGLRHGWPLSDTAHILDGSAPIKMLQTWLKNPERMMPAVIIAEFGSEGPLPPLAPSTSLQRPTGENPKALLVSEGASPAKSILSPLDILSDLPLLSRAELSSMLFSEVNPSPGKMSLPEKGKPKEEHPFDISELTRYRMGYAQFFILPAEFLETFQKTTGQAIGAGDVLLLEPAAFGGDVISLPYNRTKKNPDETFDQLVQYVQNYPKNKPMTFGKVIFLPGAKEIQRTRVLDLSRSKEELLAAFTEKEQAAVECHRSEMLKMQEKCELKDEKIKRLNDQIRQLENSSSALREEMDSLKESHRAQLCEKNEEIQRLHSLLNRPARPNEVADWVECYLEGRLKFHQRARDLMEEVAPNTVDMELLCDAVEFLATDYRDLLTGLINEEEMYRRCKLKYDRPFDVAPVGEPSVNKYPGDYKIKYYKGHKGKPVESLLDYHLRVGNDNRYLLRIYFLFDKENKLIVVGSLPQHLPTVSFK